jgi:hypothetical protein
MGNRSVYLWRMCRFDIPDYKICGIEAKGQSQGGNENDASLFCVYNWHFDGIFKPKCR